MKLYSQKRISYTHAINKPLVVYGNGLINPHGYSGIYDVKNWACREGIKLPKPKPMSKSKKNIEFHVCMAKIEMELSKRKINTILEDFISESVRKIRETL